MNRRNLLLGLGGLAVVGIASAWAASSVLAETGPVFEGRTDGVAINGYDAVAYFEERKPVEGSPDITLEHGGVTWRFSSAKNRAAFAADPERFRPAYGGFCAFAMAKGQKVKTEPEAWSIVDGRLYLNYDLNVRSMWDQRQAEFIKAADGHWPKIAAE